MSTWPSPVTVGTPPADGDVPTFDTATREWTPQHGGGGATGPTGATGASGPTGATGSGGGGGAGSPVVRHFPFAYNTPGILTGAALYTPTVGDVLLDAWIEIDTAWDGTTPLGDFGTFVGTNVGWFSEIWEHLDMKMADGDIFGSPPDGLLVGNQVASWTEMAAIDAVFRNLAQDGTTGRLVTQAALGGERFVGAKFTAANPIKICVSQDGTNTGADPGSSVGSAILYLVTATPV